MEDDAAIKQAMTALGKRRWKGTTKAERKIALEPVHKARREKAEARKNQAGVKP